MRPGRWACALRALEGRPCADRLRRSRVGARGGLRELRGAGWSSTWCWWS